VRHQPHSHSYVPRLYKKAGGSKNYTGKEIGDLVVLGYVGRDTGRKLNLWLCRCACGSLQCFNSSRLGSALQSPKRCSECSNSALRHLHPVHGPASRQSWFSRWEDMVARCHRPSKKNYKWWGGRGISVCERWRENAWNYYEDVGDPPSSGMTLDRINNDGNYEPKNVRWATKQRQIHNSRIAKLNWQIVEDARARFAKGESVKKIHNDLCPDLHINTIDYAIKGKTWRRDNRDQTAEIKRTTAN